MPDQLSTGSLAPAFTLPSDDGRTLSLDSFAGRKLVLYFYPKADTAGCTREARDFADLGTAFEAASTTVVGVSADPVKKLSAFKRKHGLPLPLLSDESLEILQAYGVWVEKSMYGRRFMGIERTTFLIGPDRRIARAWRRVKVEGHAAEVLAAAREL